MELSSIIKIRMYILNEEKTGLVRMIQVLWTTLLVLQKTQKMIKHVMEVDVDMLILFEMMRIELVNELMNFQLHLKIVQIETIKLLQVLIAEKIMIGMRLVSEI